MASVTATHSPNYGCDTESSNGPTSRTTTGQLINMSSGDRIKKLMTELSESLVTLDAKEDEIRRLKEQNELLKNENDKLKQQQFKAPDHQFTPPRNIEFTRKATELRKVLDDILGSEHPYRPQRPYQSVPAISPSIFPVSNVDANKSSTSTSENSKLFRTDESATNGTSHINHENGNHSYNNQDDFSSSRPGSDQDLITQATDSLRPPQPWHNHNFVPTVSNLGIPGRRFAWTGTVSTAEQLRELFDPNDVADIRYTPPKQFAHVDLKSELAMKKAMSLDQQTKNETQGQLRVETGRPRSSNNNNPTENGQRSQNQTKNYNNNRQNKNPNGYNNNLPQKHNNNKYNPNPNYNHHNRNNNSHSSQYVPPTFVPEEKENGTNITNGTNNWINYASSGGSNQQEPKSE